MFGRTTIAAVTVYLYAVLARLTAVVEHAKHRVEWAFFLGDAAELWCDHVATRQVGTRLRQTGANTQTVRAAQGLSSALLQFVVVGIVILLGILIYSEVQTALPTPDNADLSNASSNATATFSDSMELAPLVILVGVAALILAVVQRFR